MADTLIYVCRECGKNYKTHKKCCDKGTTIYIKSEYENMTVTRSKVFQPYWTENMDAKPIYIDSARTLDREMKKRGLYLPPAKKSDFNRPEHAGALVKGALKFDKRTGNFFR
jgi:hypothetical protein